ncbi:DUF4910 domain-containing protein [Prochlorococcus sp. MIT 1223]|uniref:DUF4910 domain-containing protein n=1 Tax=Prochlorococcus sp. MIT 1223 TaxID=3096217 RepID=UPI002A757B7B|nr:DUF4910 domain-containing protein [Prochlorococcus sp. MIT 1223]
MNKLQVSNDEDFPSGERMVKLAKSLYPKNRSIMGPDIRSSFNYFLQEHIEFKPIKFNTGDKVFDWEVPEEWIVRDAYIEHESGKRFAEFKKNNLHLVGYSVAVEDFIKKEELLSKLHSIPDLPTAIPYVTSYYEKNWGFCLSHDQLSNLPEGNFKVLIDSEHKSGELWVIEAVVPGESSQEIFFSSYLCHPSMANNELSGPVLLNELINYVKGLKNRYYSYRFVLLPETIGSIAYLSKRLTDLKENMLCGYNLTCVGDERAYSHVQSRLGNNLADQALRASLKNLDNVKEYTYLDRGSDERQYCAPGIDLPLCTFCRSKFGKYPEYHTNKDDFNVVTEKGLIGSFKVMKSIINSFELGIYPKVKVLGEPQLGKRNLYPNISNMHKDLHPVIAMKNVFTYCDSSHNIFEISEKVNMNLNNVLENLKVLNHHKLVEFNHKKEVF